MKIKLITVGKKMPAWVNTAFAEYQKRLPREIELVLVELDMPKRQKNNDVQKCINKESQLILNQINQRETVIALDERGKNWNTKDLAKQLENWLQDGNDVCLLVGGPDGLSAECKQRASQQWSLSNLTLPHPMIRPIIAEQLYRAWSILNNHPYHRE